jgi:hypothetical protein
MSKREDQWFEIIVSCGIVFGIISAVAMVVL